MTETDALTTRDGLVYAAVIRHVQGEQMAPTVREIADELEISVGAAHASLTRLRDAGMVRWSPQRARTLQVVRLAGEPDSATRGSAARGGGGESR